jgi:hypothetical protein
VPGLALEFFGCPVSMTPQVSQWCASSDVLALNLVVTVHDFDVLGVLLEPGIQFTLFLLGSAVTTFAVMGRYVTFAAWAYVRHVFLQDNSR